MSRSLPVWFREICRCVNLRRLMIDNYGQNLPDDWLEMIMENMKDLREFETNQEIHPKETPQQGDPLGSLGSTPLFRPKRRVGCRVQHAQSVVASCFWGLS